MDTATFWTAVGSISTSLLILVGLAQLYDIRNEAKKERTLSACAKYDTDAIVDSSTRTLRKAQYDGTFNANPKLYRADVVSVLNYLDRIAIGIKQGLYIDTLAKDHLKHILKDHCDDYLTPEIIRKLDIRMDDYACLVELRKNWTDSQNQFRR